MAFAIEETLIAWLPGETGAPAYSAPPEEYPEKFLTVQRTGGSASPGIDEPAVAVQAWASTRLAAERLALSARDALLYGAVEIPQVRACSINSGPYLFPDEDSGLQRYQVYANLVTET